MPRFIIFAAQAQTQRTVQGIVRNDLKIAKSAAKAAETDKTFSMKNIKFWVYDGIEEADSLNCNQAALVISGTTEVRLIQIIWSGDTVGQKEKKDAVLIW